MQTKLLSFHDLEVELLQELLLSRLNNYLNVKQKKEKYVTCHVHARTVTLY